MVELALITNNYIDRESEEEDISLNFNKAQRLKKVKVEGTPSQDEAPASPQAEFKIKKKKKTEDVLSDSKKQENIERNHAKAVKYNLERLNLNKVNNLSSGHDF